VRQIDNLSAAVLVAWNTAFEPGTHRRLAALGRINQVHMAVLDGTLRRPSFHRDRIGLIVLRHELGTAVTHVDAVCRSSTIRTAEGHRRLWLERHGGERAAGILEVGIGHAVFNGIRAEPIPTPHALVAHGIETAYLAPHPHTNTAPVDHVAVQ
jgi:hypothetical protein